MTDDLRQRLRRADPADARGLPGPSTRELLEAAMRTTVKDRPDTATGDGERARRWRVAAVAAGLVAVAGVGGAVTLLDRDGTGGTGEPVDTLTLTLPASDQMSSCIPYSPDVLGQMPTAFAGTVTELEPGEVTLSVETWYRGSDADLVTLQTQSGPMTSIDGVEFEDGGRYLVTASEDGVVNGCGYSAPWSAELAGDFEAAFAG